ncbi:MAG TPA: Na+/H+ antiporter NhaA [Ohtaekwangia sp.]
MKKEKIDLFLHPIHRFMQATTTAGIALMASAVVALVWANSPWQESYYHLWEYNLTISLADFAVSKSLHHWINDGLMSIFFFVVGLELKREILAGELSSLRRALLPLVAAAGGMIVPAVLYLTFNPHEPQAAGWGIPMATDIAFALGIISLLGNRVPVSLKIFITALAIADDLGAVLVIAFFYTSDISLLSLGAGAGFMIVLVTANYLGVRSTLFYAIVGIAGLWLAFLMSGVHATIAGVLLAMIIPARTKIDELTFTDQLKKFVAEFASIPPNKVTLLEPEQNHVIHKIHKITSAATTPLQHLEHNLHPWVAFGIMPLFALANSGIEISSSLFTSTFFAGISMGIFTGLVLGKVTGVFLSSWIVVKLNLAVLPQGVTFKHIFGAGLLAGIGFTMSIFITGLAFTDQATLTEAKVGVFMASTVAGLLGYSYFRWVVPK